MNTGHVIKLVVDESSTHYVNISGGPLSYHYRVAELSIHFGATDSTGSEHTISGKYFPAEVLQIPNRNVKSHTQYKII